MQEQEKDLWKTVDVGGFAAFGTLFAFTLEAIKGKVERGETDLDELREKLHKSYDTINMRFEEMNLTILPKEFPVSTLRHLKQDLFPEMGKKFGELDKLIKHFLGGATHLKLRITKKIEDCDNVITQMTELGQEFSRNDRYWEYRNTNPERVYLDGSKSKSGE